MFFSKIMKILGVGIIVILLASSFWMPLGHAQGDGVDPSPPAEPVKLIFIHHSTGENWLNDDHGGLGTALQENNYFVSDTNYGWGPDGIGDRTDIPNWPEWFVGPNSEQNMNAVYTESAANAGGWDYYTRTMADPGGENQIIIFKSCFPNSDLYGSPSDLPKEGDDLTVGNAKYIYNQLLDYFSTRPDKLFVVITAPPMQYVSHPENARSFNNWLINDWLEDNDYPYNNVAVWDFYNVLTHPDNHHRNNNGTVEHISDHGDNSLYYDSGGDDHPNGLGSRKATEEFLPMLNVFYNRWKAGDPPISPPAQPETETGEDESGQPQVDVDEQTEGLVGSVIDNFESGQIPESDYWIGYQEEGVGTTISCNPNGSPSYSGDASLQVEFNVQAGSWASCELLFYSPEDWSAGDGLMFYLHSTKSNMHLGLMLYFGAEMNSSIVSLETNQESVDGWEKVTIPWSAFADQDSPVDPTQGLGLAFLFDGGENEANEGTVWIDDITLLGVDQTEPKADIETGVGDSDGEGNTGEENSDNQGDNGGGGICGSVPGLMSVVLFGAVWLRRREI